jgi:hypothetical protein
MGQFVSSFYCLLYCISLQVIIAPLELRSSLTLQSSPARRN